MPMQCLQNTVDALVVECRFISIFFLFGIGACLWPFSLSGQSTTPNDPLWEFQWNLRMIGAPEAWANTRNTGEVVVVVIDTGVDYTHEDLAPHMWRNPGETGLDASGHDKATNHIDDDGDGYVDDVYGIDVVSGDSDPMDEGFIATGVPVTTYHGNGCAGIIGAVSDNGKGIAGVYGGVKIMAIRALWYDVDHEFNQAQFDAHLLEAFRYVLKMKRSGVNIRATSNSYGSISYNGALREVLDDLGREGVLNVFAAGNNLLDNDDVPFYPADYNLPSILAVAASTEQEVFWALSNFGASTVHLAAPGLEIPTANRINRYTISFTGTSAAAPHVAGAIALLAGAVPTASAEQIKAALLGSTDSASAYTGQLISNGRLNINRALARLTDSNALPIVTHMEPAGPVAQTNQSIAVNFSQPMNPATVEAAFRITPLESGQFSWSEDLRQMRFLAPFARVDHRVEILGTAENTNGVRLDGNFDGTNNLTDTFSWSFGFPPANDNFADAQVIDGNTSTVAGTTHRASPESEEPNHAGNPWSAASVWYQWVAPTNGVFIFDIPEATFDTLLAVYQGENLGALTEAASNDNADQTRSRVAFEAKTGIRYHIAVAGKSLSLDKIYENRSSFGDFHLAWRPAGAPMVLTDFLPAAGPAGTQVVLRGQNLDQTTNLWIGNALATFSHHGTNQAELLATIPPNANDGPIRLAGFFGEIASSSPFVVLPPSLHIESPTPSTIILRWGATIPDIVLETTSTLLNENWTAVTNPVTRSAIETSLQLSNVGNSQYYRLKKN